MGEVAPDDAPTVLLADADVLIDYRESDMSVLKEVGARIARVAVLSHTLDEVHDVTREDCALLDIDVIEVETQMLLAAAEGEAQVSFNDNLCFLVCRERSWTCVTNDRALRRLCRGHHVKVRYGLSLMVDLVACEAIDRRRAASIARRMQKANPLHINERVLTRFSQALAAAKSRRR